MSQQFCSEPLVPKVRDFRCLPTSDELDLKVNQVNLYFLIDVSITKSTEFMVRMRIAMGRY